MVDLKTVMDGIYVGGAACGLISVLTGSYLVYKNAKKSSQEDEAQRAIPQGEPICNLSPFNNQCNRLDLDYARMQREGATQEQLRSYLREHPITTTEGQWKL